VYKDEDGALVKDFLTDDKTQTLFDAYVDTFPLKWNMHFYPQSMYCNGLYRRFQNYDFVGYMGPDFYQDLNRMAQQYPTLEPHLDEVFHIRTQTPKQQKSQPATTGNSNEGVETRAASHLLEYYTPRTVRKVLEYFAIDYVMLNLTVPSWAEEMLQQETTEE